MPIGTRLGLIYSWKRKNIINTKTHFLSLFKREQQYNQIYAIFIIIKNHLKNNLFIPGPNCCLL